MPFSIIDLIFFAHILPGDAGVIEGFIHPLTGPQHVLAMVAVGLLSAQVGGRAIWTVPLAFVALMAVGGVAGIIGGPTPIIDYGIAISIILLGIAIVLNNNIPEILALIVVGVFGLFHGYAHGEFISLEQTFFFLVAYFVGFVMSTAGLHVIGALLGFIALRSDRGTIGLRVAGLIIGLIGVFFLLN